MGETKIEWAHYTFNPWIGCTKVGDGCKNCYAEADMDKRRGRVKWGVNGTRSVTSYTYWRQPLKWNREAETEGVRKRVFCASLADVFEDWQGQIVDNKGNGLWFHKDLIYGHVDCDGIPSFGYFTEEYEDLEPLTLNTIRHFLFKIIEQTPHLDWLLLTKRPENIMRMVPEHWQKKFPKNVWIGTSCENQDAAEKRIPELFKIPAVVRFLSCEPLLGPVNMNDVLAGLPFPALISWVIVGGESGHSARAMDNEWVWSLLGQCFLTHTPFFFKQWGVRTKRMPGVYSVERNTTNYHV